MSWLCKQPAKLQYKIKEELLLHCLIWVGFRLTSIIQALNPDCFLNLENILSMPENFLYGFLAAFMFTILVPYPLWANRNNTHHEPSISNLILEFPEALYFWIPNYHFNLFLLKHHPQYARYRPFIADILRYDFQIEEALTRKASDTS